LEEAGLQAD
jgi:hypothetical protein